MQLLQDLLVDIGSDKDDLFDIDVSSYCLEDKDWELLGVALSQNNHIRKMKISGNCISPIGVEFLMDGISNNGSIRELVFNNVDLSGKRLENIATVVAQNNIDCLYLENANIHANDVVNLNIFVNGTELKSLSLNGNFLGDDGFGELLGYLSNCSLLEEFYVSDNEITERSLSQIDMLLQHISRLERLSIKGEIMPDHVVSDIQRISREHGCHIDYSESPSCMEVEDNTKAFVVRVVDNDAMEEEEESGEGPVFTGDLDASLSEDEQILQSALAVLVVLNRLLLRNLEGYIGTVVTNGIKTDSDYSKECESYFSSQSVLSDRIKDIKNEITDYHRHYSNMNTLPLIQLFVDNLGIVVASLGLPSKYSLQTDSMNLEIGPTITNTAGNVSRCGLLRIQLVLLLATLLNTAQPKVISFFITNNVIQTILMLMKMYPWNSILHNACEVLFIEAITSDDLSIKKEVFGTMSFYRIIRDGVIGFAHDKKLGRKDSAGYLGILIHLCYIIEDLMMKDETVNQLILENNQKYPISQEDSELYEELKLKNKEVVYENTDSFDYLNMMPY